MRTLSVLSAVLFLLGALFLASLGLFLRGNLPLILSTAGVYFIARGALRLGTALES